MNLHLLERRRLIATKAKLKQSFNESSLQAAFEQVAGMEISVLVDDGDATASALGFMTCGDFNCHLRPPQARYGQQICQVAAVALFARGACRALVLKSVSRCKVARSS